MLAGAYPLDGYEKTGIGRLEAQRLVQIGEMPGKKRPSGELLPLARVDLRLLDHRDMELPASDPALTARLKKLLGSERRPLRDDTARSVGSRTPALRGVERPSTPEPRQRRQN